MTTTHRTPCSAYAPANEAPALPRCPLHRSRGRSRRRAAAHRLQAFHRVVHPGAADGAGGGAQAANRARGQAGPGQHRHRLRSAALRQHRHVPGVRRHDRPGNPQESQAHGAAGDEQGAGAAGPGRRDSAGLQRRLCAGHARRRREAAGHRNTERPGPPSATQAGPVQRIHRPRRRLEGAGRPLRPAPGAHRAGPRTGLRRHFRRASGCDRHLHHRRQDRPPGPAKCCRTTKPTFRATTRWCCTGWMCRSAFPRPGPRCSSWPAASTRRR